VVGGVVYFGSDDHKLYALDAATGQPKWVFEAGGQIESSPAVANGVVYFGCHDHKFYALDAATGQKLWEDNASATPMFLSSPIVADGMLYFGSSDNTLHVFSL
jgi:outer membrane protein assembly factor BamB